MESQSMDLKEAIWIINLLAVESVFDEEQSARLQYAPYTRAITHLLMATGNVEMAAAIFGGVINQAGELKESVDWINAELAFETEVVLSGQRDKLALEYLGEQWRGTGVLALRRYRYRVTRNRAM